MASDEVPPLPPDAPRVADGRYVLVRRLGEGGMAVVYAAWDHDLRIWRAVKVLLPDFARRGSVRRRFEREARTMMAIRHPNLVRVHEVRAERALPYLVLDLVPGGSLEDWILRHGPMPERLVAEVGVQVVEGLVAVHEAGVVHRDIKPQNVLVDRDGTCKLTDFGVAQVEGGDTRTGVSMGTLGYMAPEQFADSKSVDARSDLYALGASLFVLATKRPVRDLFRLADDPSLLEAVPGTLRPILTRCLAYDRADRYPDARSVLAELVAARDGLPALGPEVPPLARPPRHDPPGGSPGEYTELQGLLEASLPPPTDERKRRRRKESPLVAPVIVEPTVAAETPAPAADRAPPPPAAPRSSATDRPGPPARDAGPGARSVVARWASAAVGTVASAFAVIAATLAVVLVGVPLALATGRGSVRAAESDVEDAERILVERVRSPEQLAADLARLRAPDPGPAGDPIGYGRTVADAARPVIAGLRQDPEEELARQRLERVVWAVDRLDAARARWRAAGADPLGRLAIGAGLAEPPR